MSPTQTGWHGRSGPPIQGDLARKQLLFQHASSRLQNGLAILDEVNAGRLGVSPLPTLLNYLICRSLSGASLSGSMPGMERVNISQQYQLALKVPKVCAAFGQLGLQIDRMKLSTTGRSQRLPQPAIASVLSVTYLEAFVFAGVGHGGVLEGAVPAHIRVGAHLPHQLHQHELGPGAQPQLTLLHGRTGLH